MPHAPDFWQRRGTVSTALLPLSLLYCGAVRLRRGLVTPLRVEVPVLCVGAVDVGGAGKTPLAAALADSLRAAGAAPHILSRGYGGRLKGPAQVDPASHTAAESGDEPLLLARDSPVWIGADRRATARLAIDAGADCLLLDDGFQNPRLAQDIRVLVFDGAAPLGNGRVLPAGPLREPLDAALSRATHVVVVGEDKTGLVGRLAARAPALPVFRARLAVPDAGRFAGRRVIGFAGIGRPQKFRATLSEIGCDVVGFQTFADHHEYAPEEIMRLVEAAAAHDATPVTTEKDALRLPAEARRMVETVPVRIVWEDEAGARLAAALLDG